MATALPTRQSPPIIEIASGGPDGRGSGGGEKSSSRLTRVPVSRSRPQVDQSDIPAGTTPPQVGQRRACARASEAL
ncbi:MAG: hypothetical protein ACM35G_07680, partial [Planctomycetaceae bacterium]